jgi:hypothetical protein
LLFSSSHFPSFHLYLLGSSLQIHMFPPIFININCFHLYGGFHPFERFHPNRYIVNQNYPSTLLIKIVKLLLNLMFMTFSDVFQLGIQNFFLYFLQI